MLRREWATLEDEAKHLVELNQSEVASIVRSYIFPDPMGNSIRVVHVDSKFFPEEKVVPIEFSPDPQYRLYHRMQVAITDPTGPDRLHPPDGWGQWEAASVVERKRRRKAG